MTDFRVGNGLDVHRFADQEGDENFIMLGGVQIPHPKKLEAHSDGDVLIHSLMDAMLGALALGDIGTHFPDTDPQYRNISSLDLLGEVALLMKKAGWLLGNADVTVVMQLPKLAPFVHQIREVLAEKLEVTIDQVSVKATTSEGLGFTGRQEGIAVYAIVLLAKA